MESTLDILEVIGQQCDLKTRLNLCLASKEYSTHNYGQFRQVELKHLSTNIKRMIQSAATCRVYSVQLHNIHEIMKYAMKFPHVLRRVDPVRNLLIAKLVEWEAAGMNRMKAVRYRTFLTTL
jgi:hypothetical protein